jgi:hypothetical protein
MDKVFTKIVIDMETLKVIECESYNYGGPWAYALGTVKQMFTGSNPQTTDLANEDSQFMQTLQNEQGTTFANQQSALNTINQANAPLVAGGAYQYGFSTAEDQALQSNIENQGATATQNSVAAEQLREQQQSGGAEVLPSGAQAALETQARETGAQQTAAQLGQEKIAGYKQGNENFENATKAEESVAELENPTGFAGAANNAGQNSLASQNAVNSLSANSLTAKLLGGAIQGGLSLATGRLSSLMSGGGGGNLAQLQTNASVPGQVPIVNAPLNTSLIPPQ